MGIQERAAFLSQIHLFRGLSEVQLQTVALQLNEKKFPIGTMILDQGGANDRLFLIQTGKVRVTYHDKTGERQLAILAAGDYFGEESMLQDKTPRPMTCRVMAVEEITAFILTREVFLSLAEQVRGLKTNIMVAVQSQRLLRSVHFDWLQEDETIHYLARKHYILLVKAISWPVLLATLSSLGMYITWYVNKPSLWWLALACLVLAWVWGLWKAIDWSNDYYVVTNRRVVWLEKVIAIYDSRQEAPLSAVLRVNVQTDMLGRFLDYGDLIIRTIAGSTLTLKTANHPEQAAALIEDFWKRSQQANRRMEQEEMRQALQDRLIRDPNKTNRIPDLITNTTVKGDLLKGQRTLANLFRLRFEDKTIVTYRKHIYVLFQQTWKPGVLALILIGLLIYALAMPSSTYTKLIPDLGGAGLFAIWFFLMLVAAGWLIYQYMDWTNDIFQVTPDQILDIDKTPLGEETSDIASLDNILSIEYERRGIMAMLLNFGNVYITVGGGEQMTFESVYNPSAVQMDIERRRLEKMARKEKEKIKDDRERTADWLAAYYHNEEKFRQADNPPEAKDLAEDEDPPNLI